MNWRGWALIALAVVTAVVLVRVVDDEGPPLGLTVQAGSTETTVATVDSSVTTTTVAGTPSTTAAAGVTTTTVAPAARPNLTQGASGADVTALQEKLKALGLYTGAIDGLYGSGVTTAVRAFQTSKGLTVDGSVGPATWAALDAATAATTTTTTTRAK